jgi:hypothetical protein
MHGRGAVQVLLGRLGASTALALAVLGGVPAAAQDLAPANLAPVGCTVSVGFARAEKGEVDARFRGIPRGVGDKQLGSIQLWKEQEWKLRFGEWGRMPLPTGAELGVQPVNVRGRTLSMKFDLPGVVSTKLRMQNHRPLMVGPLPHEDGYLVIRVEPEFTDHLATEPGSAQPSVPVNSER